MWFIGVIFLPNNSSRSISPPSERRIAVTRKRIKSTRIPFNLFSLRPEEHHLRDK
jgi:hypothetical protein